MNQDWFEMNDLIRKDFDKFVWIPLRAVHHNEKEGKYGYEGYRSDFFGTGTIAVPVKYKTEIQKLG